MADLKKYWQDLRAIEETLPDYVWLISMENRSKERAGERAGGSLVEATAAVAAKLLYAKSHRPATGEEIDIHRSHQEEIQQQAFQQRLRDKGIAIVHVK